jgi:hypothetical protein
VTIKEKTTVKEIYFPYEGLSGGVSRAITDIFKNISVGTKNKFQTALGDFQHNIPAYEEMLSQVMFSTWKITAGIAAILMPLVLSIVVTSALKTGTTSVTGYAQARESLLNWVICTAAAASSYFLLSQAIAISQALEAAITDGLAKAVGENVNWGYHLIERLLYIDITTQATSWILGIFAILLVITLSGTIILSWFAIKVVLLLVAALAPIILLMGILPPFRWLQGLWLKVTTVALLLWPVNILLIGIAVLLTTAFFFDNHISLVNDLFCYVVVAGVISVLIGLNSMFGKLVYGAAIEIAGKLKDSLSTALSMGLNLAMIPLGAARVPGKITRSMGTFKAGPGSSGGKIPDPGSGDGNTEALLARSHQRLNHSIASAVEATGLPGSRGLAAGLRLGSAAEDHNQLLQNINQGFRGQQPLEAGLDINKAIAAAKEDFAAEYQNHADAIQQEGNSYKDFAGLTAAGTHLAKVELSAMKTHADPASLLPQMGVEGKSITDAAQGYAREVLERTALRENAAFRVTSSQPLLQPRTFSPAACDWQTADSIIGKSHFSTDDIQAVDASTFHNLARAVHRLRTKGGMRLLEINHSTNDVADINGLRRWIKKALT